MKLVLLLALYLWVQAWGAPKMPSKELSPQNHSSLSAPLPEDLALTGGPCHGVPPEQLSALDPAPRLSPMEGPSRRRAPRRGTVSQEAWQDGAEVLGTWTGSLPGKETGPPRAAGKAPGAKARSEPPAAARNSSHSVGAVQDAGVPRRAGKGEEKWGARLGSLLPRMLPALGSRYPQGPSPSRPRAPTPPLLAGALGSRLGAGTPGSPPSLPTACLLSESAIACGSVHMKQVPALSDPGLKMLHLAATSIRHPSMNPSIRPQPRTSSIRHPSMNPSICPQPRPPKLESLGLSHNRLVHVPSFLPRRLLQLTLHHNRIERVPGYVFGHLRLGLESLGLSHNRLRAEGLHPASFAGLRRSLGELLLDHNWLQAVPRGLPGLKGLQVVRLTHNLIRQVPLDSECDTRAAEDSGLVSLRLEQNLIDPRRIPPTASCLRAWHGVVLRPQRGRA
ncbi:uncharacterized protein RBU57_017354 [Macrochelys suwanniensis]